MKARFILEDSSIEYEGDFNFKSDNYVGVWLMTSHCNIPRKVKKDEIVDGVRTIHLGGA